ncbi:MAG: DUF3576 domain-containing protein [Rhodospirillales bacterium]|jgi:hypothetical protein|nr:hypothetical protein [Rhodospirillaceae bacterium]MDP6428312.1 DUF3576 domain-containing protein [Rhodospirillales bacterium]MDP6642557.1 DUF3576 domain-containing protein [Rhodospirillales bacterium]MDP6841896.1 DUF3576 domain-containing protein [Rhodospirillales bacterium]
MRRFTGYWRWAGGRISIAILATALLSACESEYYEAETVDRDPTKGDHPVQGSILGRDNADFLFGNTGSPTIEPGGGGIGVNAYLWRATLDTMSIWPVASADPFGGVIITDWYAPPATPNERFKLNIYILDRALRADGLRVAVFRQVRATSGEWRNAAAKTQTATQIENAILTRARQFRNRTVQ